MSQQSATFLWEQINKHHQATRKPVHVAVAYTADAAAASLTLTSLLKASLIQYDVQPIATLEEVRDMVESANLAQQYAQLSDSDLLVDEFFILVGIGAAVPLHDFFDFSRHIVIVLDAYRPFHLANLREQDDARLLVWGNERIREEVDDFFRTQREAAARQRRRRRRRQAVKRRRRLRRRFEKERGLGGVGLVGGGGGGAGDDHLHSSVDGENSGENEEEETASSSSSEEDDDDDLNDKGLDDDDEDDASVSVSQSQERTDWTDPEDLPPFLETLYYACERAGRSCAVEAHDLAVLLNRFKDATLWHAAVGVCDLFNRRLIDYGAYLVEMRPLHDAVTLQKSVRRTAATTATAAAAADGGGGVESDTASHADGEESYWRRKGSSGMELLNRDEEQLHLLRHTTLWDAIWHHPVTASVLRFHHVEDGEGHLRQLLARCGVSVTVAQQPWREVAPGDKAEALRLVQAELRHLQQSRARFLTYPNDIRCICRTVGFSTEVSTFDACTLHEALLAAVPPRAATTLEAHYAGDAAAAEQLVAQRLRQCHREQFWKAHAVLDMDPSSPAFQAAVREAMLLQRAVAAATGALMQPGMLQSTAGLHYTVPSDPTRTTTALESFNNVFRLNALAQRLLLTLTVERGLGRYTHTVRPLLLACALPTPTREEADFSFVALPPTNGPTTNTATAASMASMPMLLNGVSTNTLAGAGGAAKANPNSGRGLAGSSADLLLGTVTTAGAAASLGMGGGSAAFTDGHAFVVMLAHAGASGAAMQPIPAVGRFLGCVQDEDEFDTAPRQAFAAQRGAVVVADRATAAHLADIVYLACLSSRWDPQREYAAALAEAQQHEGEGQGDDDEGDEGSEGGDATRHGHNQSNGGGGRKDEYDDDDINDEDGDEDNLEACYYEQDSRQLPLSQQRHARDGSSTAVAMEDNDESSRGPVTVL